VCVYVCTYVIACSCDHRNTNNW